MLRDDRYAVIAICLIFIVLCVVGAADQLEAERQDIEYCVNVAEGKWPDYKQDEQGPFLEHCFKK